jgi:hypothetical protein
MIRLPYNLLQALIAGLNGKDVKTGLLNMQKSIDYLIEKSSVLHEQLKSKNRMQTDCFDCCYKAFG